MNLIKFIVRVFIYINIFWLWTFTIAIPTSVFFGSIMAFYQTYVNGLYFAGTENTWTSLYKWEIVAFIWLTIFIAMILSIYIMKWLFSCQLIFVC